MGQIWACMSQFLAPEIDFGPLGVDFGHNRSQVENFGSRFLPLFCLEATFWFVRSRLAQKYGITYTKKNLKKQKMAITVEGICSKILVNL